VCANQRKDDTSRCRLLQALVGEEWVYFAMQCGSGMGGKVYFLWGWGEDGEYMKDKTYLHCYRHCSIGPFTKNGYFSSTDIIWQLHNIPFYIFSVKNGTNWI
jgi:hypothetical protein